MFLYGWGFPQVRGTIRESHTNTVIIYLGLYWAQYLFMNRVSYTTSEGNC